MSYIIRLLDITQEKVENGKLVYQEPVDEFEVKASVVKMCETFSNLIEDCPDNDYPLEVRMHREGMELFKEYMQKCANPKDKMDIHVASETPKDFTRYESIEDFSLVKQEVFKKYYENSESKREILYTFMALWLVADSLQFEILINESIICLQGAFFETVSTMEELIEIVDLKEKIEYDPEFLKEANEEIIEQTEIMEKFKDKRHFQHTAPIEMTSKMISKKEDFLEEEN